MDRVISFPHLGNYYIVFDYFIRKATKCKVIVPPATTKRTIEIGSKYAPSFVCVPFKYNLGNYIEALEKGANTLVQGGGGCRYGYYGELEENILKELRLKGLILEDARVVRSMDHQMDEISLVIPAKIKAGEVTALGNQKNLIVSQDQFDQLRDYNTQLIKRVCTRLIGGDISITPVKKGEVAACTYCYYKSICQFDPSLKGNDYKKIKKLEPQEAWLIIDQGGVDHAKMD